MIGVLDFSLLLPVKLSSLNLLCLLFGNSSLKNYHSLIVVALSRTFSVNFGYHLLQNKKATTIAVAITIWGAIEKRSHVSTNIKTYNFDIAILARVITLWGALKKSPIFLPQYWGKHLLFGCTNIIFAHSKQTLIAIDPFFDRKYSRRKYYWGLSKGLFLYCLPFSFALLTLRQQN